LSNPHEVPQTQTSGEEALLFSISAGPETLLAKSVRDSYRS
jgi:hypothetical protein